MSTYGNDSTISLTDRLFGVDAEDANNTKNYVVSDLITFIGGNLPSSVTQASNISYDNTASILVATDVQEAIDELDTDIELVADDVLANELAIDGLVSVTDANALAIGNNASDINALGISKRDVLAPGVNLTAGINLSSMVADEYRADDTGGGVTITIDATANTNFGMFESRWVHYVFSGAGLTINTSGGQTVLGNTSWGATGSYRITKIDTDEWMVS